MADRRPSVRTVVLGLAMWIALASPAAAIDTSVEHPLSTAELAESPSNEHDPDVACGAGTCLGVWAAGFENHLSLNAARVGPDGATLDPTPIRLDTTGYRPTVAWTGSAYLVVWVVSGQGYEVRAKLVSEQGTAGPLITVAASSSYIDHVSVAVLDGAALVVWQQSTASGGESDIRGARLSAEGGVLDPAGIAIAAVEGSQQLNPAVAADGSRWLVVWSDGRGDTFDVYANPVSAEGAVTDADGSPVSNASGNQTGVSIAGDGTGFVVGWTDTRSGDPDVYVTRISSSLTVLDPAGVGIATNAGVTETAGELAHNDTAYVMAWDAQVNLGASGSVRVATLDSEAAPSATTVVGDTGAGANTPAIAARGSGSAVVWLDNLSGTRSVRLRRLAADRLPLEAMPIVLSNAVEHQEWATISFDGTNYLVAWLQRRAGGARADLRAGRVQPDGTLLDPAGIEVATDIALPTATAERAVVSAWDGSSHLLVWQAGGDVHAKRIGASGAVLDASPILLGAAAGTDEKDPAVAAAPTGGFLVAWTRAVGSSSDVVGTRVSSAGVPLDGTLSIAASSEFEALPAVAFAGSEFHVVHRHVSCCLNQLRVKRVSSAGAIVGTVTVPGGAGTPMIATDGTGLLVGFQTDSGVGGVRMSQAGTFTGSPVAIMNVPARRTRLAHNGGQWVVAGETGSGAVTVTHLSPDLVWLSHQTFADNARASLVAGPSGTVGLTHDRWADEAPYHGARRAFMRTIRRHAILISGPASAVPEGQPAQFTVSIAPPRAGVTVTVDYSTEGSFAQSGSDFQAVNGTLTFSPGTSSQSVSVPTIDDSDDESDIEEFYVRLSNASGADLISGPNTNAVAQARIADNDPSPAVSVSDVTVDEDAGVAGVLLQLSKSSGRTVRVNVGPSPSTPGTARNGSDYTLGNINEIVFAPGQTQRTFDIPITGDSTDEPDEWFDVRLGSPLNATIGDEYGRVTITDDDPTPQVSVDPVSAPEGDTLTSAMVATVRLTNPSHQTITVKLSTADGTASAPGDYSSVTGHVLTFDPGVTQRTLGLTVIADTVDELDETFALNLSEPVNATLSVLAATATATVLDDDGPAMTVADAATTEGQSGTTVMTFDITLSAPTAQDVSGSCSTANGSATGGVDYTSTSGPFAIPAGQTGTTSTVPVLADALDEIDETFTLACTVNAAAELADGTAVGTITDDDPMPALSVIDPPPVMEGDAGTQVVDVAVRLSTASGRAVTAQLGTSDGSATAPDDYAQAAGIALSFAPGETEKLVPITVIADAVDELDETFSAGLTDVVGASPGDPTALLGITDDDGPAVSVGDATAAEGDSGMSPLVFPITLAAPSPQNVTGTCVTGDGAATAGSDYTATSAPFSVPAGQTATAFAVPVLGDEVDEVDEEMSLTCTVDASGDLGDGEAVGRIVDDDEPPSTAPAVAVVDATVVEGATARVQIQLSAPSAEPVTVRARTVDGTAVAPADYTAADRLVAFAPGVTSQSLEIAAAADSVSEPAESLTVELSEVVNATLGRNAVVTIADGTGAGTGGSGGLTAPGPMIARGTLRLDKRGRIRVAVTCPPSAGAPACAGKLTIATAKAVKVRGRRRIVKLGTASFAILRGQGARVVVRPARAQVALIRRLRRVRVKVTAGPSRRTVLLRGR